MDIGEIYHFLFETMPGVGVLILAGIVLSIILSAIFEVGIRKRYKTRDEEAQEEWDAFAEEVAAAEAAEIENE